MPRPVSHRKNHLFPPNDFGVQVVYIDELSAALRVFPEKVKLLSKSV